MNRIQNLMILIASGAIVLAMLCVRNRDAASADELPKEYRETVQKGLDFLTKHQFDDGHWEGEDGKYPAAMTALAGIALHMEEDQSELHKPLFGGVTKSPKYFDNINKAVKWFMSKSKVGGDGLIYSDHASEATRYMEGHGLATLFLATANSDMPDKRRAMVRRAVGYILRSQSSQGGWYHTSKLEGHDLDAIIPTVIQIQALWAADNFGDALRDGQTYLKNAASRFTKKVQADANGDLICEIAAALAGRADKQIGFKDDFCKKWLPECAAKIPMGPEMKFGRDELRHFYFAQASFTLNSELYWTIHRKKLFDTLKDNQNADGSWPASEGLGSGRVYSTAIWCIVMQLDKMSYPSQSRYPAQAVF